jgi:hypothetical protein
VRELVADTATRLHVALTGIDERSVALVLTDVTGTAPNPAWVASVASRSGGNPFFVRQLGSMPAGEREGLPAAVGGAVAARVGALEPGVRDALLTAAVIGRRFEDDLLVGASVTPADLDEAVATGLLERDGADRHLFVHDLVREHLLASLDPADARERHRAVALALAASDAAEMRTSRLAGHAVLAVPELGAAQAVAWCREAAREAVRLHAYDEAARHLRAASSLDGDPGLRLDLAEALLRGGHRDEARDIYEKISSADPVIQALAVLGRHQAGVPIDVDHGVIVRALEDALAALGSGEPVLRARVLAALARELSDGPLVDQPRARALADEALVLARASGDRSTLGACLFARHDVVWGPGTASERVALGAELAHVARDAGDPGLAFEGLLCRYVALLELGDVAAGQALAELERAAESSGQPFLGYLAASRRDGWAIMQGRFDEERLTRTFELARRIEVPEAYGVYATQLLTVDLARLDPGRIVSRHAELGNTLMPPDFETEERAWELVGRGDLDGAREVIEAAAPPERRSLFRWRALAAVAISVEIAHRTRSRAVCAAAYDVLLPHAGTLIVIGGGVSVVGPVDLFLALCADVLGDRERRRAHAETGLVIARRLDARRWEERLAGLAERHSSAVFRREDRVWRLEFEGTVVHLPHHKGLADLAVLLGRPGEEVTALELTGGAPQLGSDPVLDNAAKAAYGARLTTLDEEIRATGDASRLEDLEAERAVIVEELAAATGLGGRSRRLGDPGERARSTVTARIRDVLRRLDGVHPALAAHLRASVRTGRRCSYQPEQPVDWSL